MDADYQPKKKGITSMRMVGNLGREFGRQTDHFQWTSLMDEPLLKFGRDMGWISWQLDATLNPFTYTALVIKCLSISKKYIVVEVEGTLT